MALTNEELANLLSDDEDLVEENSRVNTLSPELEQKRKDVLSKIEQAQNKLLLSGRKLEELKKEGLTTETVNASQKFVKAHPSATIYEKYSRQYTAIIHTLIEYLPPKEKKNISRLAALRNG